MHSRHERVWLTAQGWKEAAASVRPGDLRSLALWERQGWPAVVRRRDVGAAGHVVSLGIALPPSGADAPKERIGLRVDAAHIQRRLPALGLIDAMEAAPAAWRADLAVLAGAGVALRAYGSLALQAITGLPYLTPASDIDLLLAPGSRAELDAGIALLSHYAETLPLDGEVVFPGGAAVAWKEWRDAGPRSRVLVKTIDAVRLAERAALLATLEER
jgi:phosphoribosyl-dephospho-CoA transferase